MAIEAHEIFYQVLLPFRLKLSQVSTWWIKREICKTLLLWTALWEMIENWRNCSGSNGSNCGGNSCCHGNDSETKVAQLMSSYCWAESKGDFQHSLHSALLYYIKFAPSYCSNYILSRNLFVIAATTNCTSSPPLEFGVRLKEISMWPGVWDMARSPRLPQLPAAGIMLLRRSLTVPLPPYVCACVPLKCHGNQKLKSNQKVVQLLFNRAGSIERWQQV